jgi:predicted nucleic acid-binding protein
MPDRVIAATALARALALVSRDARIRAANLQTVW